MFTKLTTRKDGQLTITKLTVCLLFYSKTKAVFYPWSGYSSFAPKFKLK